MFLSSIEMPEDKSYFYDLSPLVTTLQIAVLKNTDDGRNLVFQTIKLLEELDILENSNFYEINNKNCFYSIFIENDTMLKQFLS